MTTLRHRQKNDKFLVTRRHKKTELDTFLRMHNFFISGLTFEKFTKKRPKIYQELTLTKKYLFIFVTYFLLIFYLLRSVLRKIIIYFTVWIAILIADFFTYWIKEIKDFNSFIYREIRIHTAKKLSVHSFLMNFYEERNN